MKIYIGIDLAWGEKTPSSFALLASKGDGVELLDLQLIQSLDIIVQEIQKYLHYDVSIGVDALKGKALKNYEDKLDAITSAYTLFYCESNPHKIYRLDDAETFITPL